ncbi:MAG: hypothetical protein JOZ69_13090 [Myxococcales bacterium]|nr:hypothetical protein [Myxococcales bacterium]
MFTLLSFWPAWRAVQLITAVVVIIGALILVAYGHESGARHSNAPLTKLRHAVHPVEQQLDRTIDKAFKR